ncbi:MAG TPA: DUF2891 domain-containing protein [Gammaproteobacteria bacterium]|nr:DUF2891 domain-containing protein [Gammaproteobacteria bacterium]
MNTLDEATAMRLTRMVLDNVIREYPNHIMHLLNADADALPPRALHPAFYGSYDWHSAVHSHWLLVRVLRLFPRAECASSMRDVLERHLSADNMAQECRYFEPAERVTYERPYGLAWLLQLAAELAEWDTPDARRWRERLLPLERLAAQRLGDWLQKLGHPVRGGEHANSAFALALTHDWCVIARDETLRACIEQHARRLYLADRQAPLAYEPSGQDFLSPALAEADLLRRVLPQAPFAAWLDEFLPQLPRAQDAGWLPLAGTQHATDPKLAHLDGLNLSRAWMLQGIASALPAGDARRGVLLDTAQAHAQAGLAAIHAERYAGSHWLPSFAVYLLTRRGQTA